MAFHTPVHTPSRETLALTRLGIVLAVVLTAIASAMIVKMRLDHYQINPDQIPIADMDVWRALGR